MSSSNDVTRFFRRGLVFALPFVCWAAFVFVIDPFDYFNVTHVIPEDVKVANVSALNNLMFNMLREKHSPCENLVIGDSRVESFSLDQIQQITRLRYERLTSNALKLNEAIDLFYFANALKPLKHVVLGLNFNQYNEYAYADRVTSVEAVIRNPLLYMFDRSVAQACLHVLEAQALGHAVVNSAPPMSEDEFWNFMVTTRSREQYGKYKYPAGMYARLKEMVRQAAIKGTEVTLVIVPHHKDYTARVSDYGLLSEYDRFKSDMSSLPVRILDFDYPNDITSERSNFRDPLHTTDAVTARMVQEIFANRPELAHVLSFSESEKHSGLR